LSPSTERTRPIPLRPRLKPDRPIGESQFLGEKFLARRDKDLTTKTARIEAAGIKFLKKKGARATSGELLAAMAEAGIEITGKEPNKALSAYLSGSDAFNNVRESGGYGLTEWGNRPGPDLLTKTGA
jgi:hypothetical protein